MFQEMGSLKSLLYFGKWSFSVYFSKESCSYISGKENPEKKPLIFNETELSSISGNRNPKKLEVTCKA